MRVQLTATAACANRALYVPIHRGDGNRGKIRQRPAVSQSSSRYVVVVVSGHPIAEGVGDGGIVFTAGLDRANRSSLSLVALFAKSFISAQRECVILVL